MQSAKVCLNSEEILERLRRRGREQNSLNHDALIALVSKEMDIEYIVSFDKDFDKIEWLKRVEYEG